MANNRSGYLVILVAWLFDYLRIWLRIGLVTWLFWLFTWFVGLLTWIYDWYPSYLYVTVCTVKWMVYRLFPWLMAGNRYRFVVMWLFTDFMTGNRYSLWLHDCVAGYVTWWLLYDWLFAWLCDCLHGCLTGNRSDYLVIWLVEFFIAFYMTSNVWLKGIMNI